MFLCSTITICLQEIPKVFYLANGKRMAVTNIGTMHGQQKLKFENIVYTLYRIKFKKGISHHGKGKKSRSGSGY